MPQCTSAAVEDDEAWAMTVSVPPDAASLLLVGFIVSTVLAEIVHIGDNEMYRAPRKGFS